MTAQFSVLDSVLIIGICQGLFLTLSLLRISNTNKKANSILSLLIGIATLMLLGRFLYYRHLTPFVFQWSLIFDTLVFLFGPLLYLYVRRLLFQESPSYKLSRFHFIPLVVMLICIVYCLAWFTPEEYLNAYREGNLDLFFTLVLFAGIVSNAIYLVRSVLLLRDSMKQQKNNFSFSQNPINYMRFFLIAYGVLIAAWLFSFLNYALLNKYFTYINYNGVWVAIPVFIYVIGYYSLKQPELFRLPISKPKEERKERLQPAEITVLKNKLDSLMLNEKVFLKSNLTLKEVAGMINTSTNNLSWLLNSVYNMTFYDFVNGYRIKEFLFKIKNKEHLQHTILALSLDVGFNSKSTFNKVFKATMNETPSHYIKKQSAA